MNDFKPGELIYLKSAFKDIPVLQEVTDYYLHNIEFMQQLSAAIYIESITEIIHKAEFAKIIIKGKIRFALMINCFKLNVENINV